mgnify:CR=1 FL=1
MNIQGLRGGLYNPTIRDMVRKSECSPSANVKMPPKGRRRGYSQDELSKKRYLSNFESLVFYFGEEWFDLKNQLGDSISANHNAKMRRQPSRCDKCEREWAVDSEGQYYLDDSFKRLPVQTDTCMECE